MRRPLAGVRALLFDVFGTVVDWRGSIVREGRAFGRSRGIRLDWPAFADAWRARYVPSMDRVRRGELPWTSLDDLHRASLRELLAGQGLLRGLRAADIEHLNRMWHRLRPWPDVRAGLARLKRRYTIATLSNGNVALLADMAKQARLPWDVILSAELFRHYKPDPEVYLGAVSLLGLEPREAMLVAAHKGDLRAARRCGLRTALVERPAEYGPSGVADRGPERYIDLVADGFPHLARQLEAVSVTGGRLGTPSRIGVRGRPARGPETR